MPPEISYLLRCLGPLLLPGIILLIAGIAALVILQRTSGMTWRDLLVPLSLQISFSCLGSVLMSIVALLLALGFAFLIVYYFFYRMVLSGG